MKGFILGLVLSALTLGLSFPALAVTQAKPQGPSCVFEMLLSGTVFEFSRFVTPNPICRLLALPLQQAALNCAQASIGANGAAIPGVNCSTDSDNSGVCSCKVGNRLVEDIPAFSHAIGEAPLGN